MAILAGDATAKIDMTAKATVLADLVANAPELKPQVIPPTPNTIYLPQVIMQTGLVMGVPQVFWSFVLHAALDDGNGTLTDTGQTATIPIGPRDTLEDGVSDSLASILNSLNAVAATINANRQLI
jgi:hypothetical protein